MSRDLLFSHIRQMWVALQGAGIDVPAIKTDEFVLMHYQS